MGILDKFKHKNDIKPDVEKLTGLVYPYALKRGSIKNNSNLIVPNGYSFVIGYTGKALDCFNEGEYVLSPTTLPECCKKLKIHKGNNGKPKKWFKANAYFVKLAEYEYSFKTIEKAELGNRASGIFTVGLSGTVKIKIVDAKKFVAALLQEYDYLKQNEAEKILKILTSELVVKILNKYNFALSEFINCNEIIHDKLFLELGQKFSKIGLNIEELSKILYILPKKHQKLYESNLQKTNETNLDKEIKTEEIEMQEVEQETEIKEDLKHSDTKNLDTEYEYVPFGNIVIEQEKNITLKQEKPKTIQQEDSTQFIDLDLDNLYKDKQEGIRCDCCGYLNEKSNVVCELCERKLNREDN